MNNQLSENAKINILQFLFTSQTGYTILISIAAFFAAKYAEKSYLPGLLELTPSLLALLALWLLISALYSAILEVEKSGVSIIGVFYISTLVFIHLTYYDIIDISVKRPFEILGWGVIFYLILPATLPLVFEAMPKWLSRTIQYPFYVAAAGSKIIAMIGVLIALIHSETGSYLYYAGLYASDNLFLQFSQGLTWVYR